MIWKGLLHQYKDRLPISDKTPAISLFEGNTPMIPLDNLAAHYQIPAKWYIKFEGMNPTGSFKDRGMCMAIAKAKEAGAKAVICASTGNTSASAAAYAARAKMSCFVIIPEGKIALGKLSQAMLHGAKVIQIKGNFDKALEFVQQICEQYPIALVNSINPYRIEGQKTIAFEIIEALGDAPSFHSIPVGNAGNITATWKGYNEALSAGDSTRLPKMLGFQAAGSAPIVLGHVVEKPDTIATAIRIGNPVSWKQAEAARDLSGGTIDKIDDETITHFQKELARLEGVFCEPACAVALAGVVAYHQKHPFNGSDSIVSTITGHGLKDPERAIEIAEKPLFAQDSLADIASIITKFL